MASATCFLLETSNFNVVTSVKSLKNTLSLSNLFPLLPQRINRILFFANNSAVAFPMPDVAPVMSAVFMNVYGFFFI